MPAILALVLTSCAALLGLSSARTLEAPAPAPSSTVEVQWKIQEYKPLNVTAGQRVDFVWKGVHGIYSVPSAECPATFSPTANGQKELAPTGPGGNYTTPPLEPGHYYYACPVGDHCKEGQHIEVNVA